MNEGEYLIQNVQGFKSSGRIHALPLEYVTWDSIPGTTSQQEHLFQHSEILLSLIPSLQNNLLTGPR